MKTKYLRVDLFRNSSDGGYVLPNTTANRAT